MNLKYTTISQPITGLLAYRNESALVQLGNGRVATVPASTLSRAGINPVDGPACQPLATRITAMREALIGKHAALRRNGASLFVTVLSTIPVEVLHVSDADVAEICSHASRGGSLSKEMKVVVRFLRNARNSKLHALYSKINTAIQDGREDPAPLGSLGESLVAAFV